MHKTVETIHTIYLEELEYQTLRNFIHNYNKIVECTKYGESLDDIVIDCDIPHMDELLDLFEIGEKYE